MKEQVIQSVREISLLSPNAVKLLQVHADPDHNLEDLLRLVRFDSSLTARLLRMVNSPVFGLVNPIESLDRAVSYLGERMVIGLAIGDSASSLLKRSLAGYESGGDELWNHELFTAVAAREIASASRDEVSPELAFTAGLLHDVGKSVLSAFISGTAREVLGKIDAGDIDNYLAAERDILGLDHAEAGYELARHWELPETLREVIRYHHEPRSASESGRCLAYAVHLGDILAMLGGCGTGSDSLQHSLDADYARHFDLTPESLSEILLASQEEYRKASRSFEITKEEKQ